MLCPSFFNASIFAIKDWFLFLRLMIICSALFLLPLSGFLFLYFFPVTKFVPDPHLMACLAVQRVCLIRSHLFFCHSALFRFRHSGLEKYFWLGFRGFQMNFLIENFLNQRNQLKHFIMPISAALLFAVS